MAEGYTSLKTSVNNSRGRPSRYSENPDFIDGFVEKVEDREEGRRISQPEIKAAKKPNLSIACDSLC